MEILFLIYVNDMSQPVNFHVFLYDDDWYLVSLHKDIPETGKQFLKILLLYVISLWIIRIIRINFLLLNTTGKFLKNFKYGGDIQIKQHSKAKYFGCFMDDKMMFGETTTRNVINKTRKAACFISLRLSLKELLR